MQKNGLLTAEEDVVKQWCSMAGPLLISSLQGLCSKCPGRAWAGNARADARNAPAGLMLNMPLQWPCRGSCCMLSICILRAGL